MNILKSIHNLFVSTDNSESTTITLSEFDVHQQVYNVQSVDKREISDLSYDYGSGLESYIEPESS